MDKHGFFRCISYALENGVYPDNEEILTSDDMNYENQGYTDGPGMILYRGQYLQVCKIPTTKGDEITTD